MHQPVGLPAGWIRSRATGGRPGGFAMAAVCMPAEGYHEVGADFGYGPPGLRPPETRPQGEGYGRSS